jgi:hypothetical protein
MPALVDEIAEHDGGWAYRLIGAWSQTFASHDEARAAAEVAAREQLIPGEGTDIVYEDEQGRWHTETISGHDRPEPQVKG